MSTFGNYRLESVYGRGRARRNGPEITAQGKLPGRFGAEEIYSSSPFGNVHGGDDP